MTPYHCQYWANLLTLKGVQDPGGLGGVLHVHGSVMVYRLARGVADEKLGVHPAVVARFFHVCQGSTRRSPRRRGSDYAVVSNFSITLGNWLEQLVESSHAAPIA